MPSGHKTMRLRRYTRWAGYRVACGDYRLLKFCHPGGLAPTARHITDNHKIITQQAVGGRQAAPAPAPRYTGVAGDRVACGDYRLFLFCHPGEFGAYGATYP